MTKNLLYLPKSKILVNLNAISFVRVFVPKKINMEFPELLTRKKRPEETQWRCMVCFFNGSGEVTLSGKEAYDFLSYLSDSIDSLEVEIEEIEPEEEE